MNRCSACPGARNCVPPSGPVNCEYIFIGEAPGWDENKRMTPFTGKTGRELDETYLPSAGLRRPNVRVDNAMKCMPVTSKGKLDMGRWQDREMVKTCAEAHLFPELYRIQPKLIVAMGAFACYVLDPNINLDLHHGIPLSTDWGIVYPMYHPAGGLHEPKKMLQIRTDWLRLRRYLAGTLELPEDLYPNPDYQEITDAREYELDPTRPLACDTESSRSIGPYCLTFSNTPGTGRLIRADREDLLKDFQGWISRWEAPIIWHNWLYDRRITGQMGLRFPNRLIRDTMVRAFLLGNLPQGLKALAYRELGMTMQDFDDLVIPYSKQLILKYYRDAYNIEWPKPEEQMLRGDDGKWKTYKAQSMNTKLKTFFTAYGKNEDKDVFKMWEENWTASQGMIEEQMGPFPGRDIAHVPFDEVLAYACRDSDATLRLWPILEHMRKKMRHLPQEKWRDGYERD